MAQNTSHAVMQQRKEPHNSLDDFPTPPWATRALMEHVIEDPAEMSVWEPTCNRGYMARPLDEYFKNVYTSDIHDYGWPGQESIKDFLVCDPPDFTEEWIICNPPFRLAEKFIARALQLAEHGVAVIVRTSFLEGVGRYNRLFSQAPPNIIAQFTERVPMVKGRYDPEASTATSYCWLVWQADLLDDTQFVWIPPCRRELERKEDYQENGRKNQ